MSTRSLFAVGFQSKPPNDSHVYIYEILSSAPDTRKNPVLEIEMG